MRIENENEKVKILAIGDVTSRGGIEHLQKNLWRVRSENKIDFCVVNGENASFISGISPESAEILLRSGADAITGGNHTMHNRQCYTFMDEHGEMLRPINFGGSAPGRGASLIDCSGRRVLVINALGNVHIEPCLDNPYKYIDAALAENAGKYDISILDFHAEATGEKLALAHEYDGKINVIFGTHTHVPTADTEILPNGTGYVSDLGMCGESGGILGMDKNIVRERMKTRLPIHFAPANGPCQADGVIFTVDEKSGRTTEVLRIKF